MAAKNVKSKRLPKAPLIEVIFELRWALQGGSMPGVVQSDPGLIPLIEAFTTAAKKQKFSVFKDQTAHPLQAAGHSIVRRFYRGADLPFPILQIGPGIFASNAGPTYKWDEFKKQTISGLDALLHSYPKVSFFPLSPIGLDLRYVDHFNKSILGNAKLFHFLKHATSFQITPTKMLDDSTFFSGDADGRLLFRRHLKGRKDTIFDLDIASASLNTTGEDVVQMTSRITSTNGDVPSFSTPKKLLSAVSAWLEDAHDITHPFFEAFILPSIMKKFEGK